MYKVFDKGRALTLLASIKQCRMGSSGKDTSVFVRSDSDEKKSFLTLTLSGWNILSVK